MKKEFDDVYKQIIGSYEDVSKSTPFQRKAYIDTKNSISVIVHRLVNFFDKNGVSVRNDAIHFLLINLHQLVALPLELEHEFNKKVFKQLNADVESILIEANMVSIEKNKKRKENEPNFFHRENAKTVITGGDVIKAIGNIYEDLNLSQVRLWGG
ncbi:MAG: hypothetical protein VYB81_18775 [Pseudomonadota bacterium]|nr:hypothetical protein [Pseudomonadota bacterium]